MVEFQSYDIPLVAVSDLKYLGRVLTASDGDWPAVMVNLMKARKRWERMSSILGQEGSYPRNSGNFYKVLVQATLLFGAESWGMPPCIGSTLGGFHPRVICRL